MMKFKRVTAGRLVFDSLVKIFTGTAACGFLTAFLVLAAPAPGQAGEGFPFDQGLVLDAAPMRPAKRVPVLTVAADGRATIDLWCRTVPALVQLSDNAIKIETAPLSESLPQYMSAGQCSEPRMQADAEMLQALAQVTEWRKQGNAVVLAGPTTLVFRPATN